MREEEFELELVNSLKEISYDDRNKEYMTELSDRTIHFDKVSDQYAILKGKNNLKSIDGLYTEGFSKIFIEFKNGRIVSGNEVNKNKLKKIEGKILSSETILCDMIGEEQEYMKDNIDFILVYSEEKNKDYKKEEVVKISPSLEKLSIGFLKLGKKEFIKFGLEKYKGSHFKEVHTYTKEEFEGYMKKQKKNIPAT